MQMHDTHTDFTR